MRLVFSNIINVNLTYLRGLEIAELKERVVYQSNLNWL